MRLGCLVFVASLLGCTSSPDPEGEVARLREQAQVDCGVVAHGPELTCAADPQPAIDCFLAAADDCEPARLRMTQTYTDSGFETEMFVVPEDGRCDIIVYWENHDGWPPPGSTGMETRLSRCTGVAHAATESGCSTVDPTACVEL